MRSHPLLAINQLSAALGIRSACLIFFVAMIFVGSTTRASAQYFSPFERNYYYGPRVTPRQNFDTSPPPDERFASETKRKVIEQLRVASAPPPTNGRLLLIVSITKQTVTLYDAGVAVVESSISSGTSENPTPTGIFSVIEKNWWHRSNIYSAAPMPYMQRINWEGVALHAGDLPGYPASHGCIRLTYDFALRLWLTTKIGARVIVTHDDVTPINILHPRLFVPQSDEERTPPTQQEVNAVAGRPGNEFKRALYADIEQRPEYCAVLSASLVPGAGSSTRRAGRRAGPCVAPGAALDPGQPKGSANIRAQGARTRVRFSDRNRENGPAARNSCVYSSRAKRRRKDVAMDGRVDAQHFAGNVRADASQIAIVDGRERGTRSIGIAERGSRSHICVDVSRRNSYHDGPGPWSTGIRT